MSTKKETRRPAVDWWDRIEEAKVFLGSGPSGRKEAQRLLEAIVSEAQGTAAASAAMDLLRLGDIGNQPPERKDPGIEALRKEWLTIVTAWDVRLPGFLARLQQSPGAWAELMHEVKGILQRWYSNATQQIRKVLDGTEPEPDTNRLAEMERLAAAVAAIPSLEAELRSDLLQFSEARFRLLLSQLEGEVLRACRAWEIDRAWALMDRLDNAPTACEEAVRELEQAISEADALRTEVEVSIDHWRGEKPAQWAGLRVLLESLAEARRLLADPGVPPAWRENLNNHVEQLVEAGRSFFLKHADAGTTEELREFWRSYQRFDPARIDSALQEQPDWYEPTVQRMQMGIAEVALAAAGYGELEGLAQRLSADLSSLPASVSIRLTEWHEQLHRIAEAWRQMEKGEELTSVNELLSAATPFLPKLFRDQVPQYQKTLAQVRSSSDRLEKAGRVSNREAACEEALKTARRVLAEMPKHRGALLLRQKAEQRRVQLRLDDALSRWDVDAFLGSPRLLEAEARYRELSKTAVALRELAGLTVAPELSDSREAARWWQRWEEASKKLPPALPDAFIDVRQAEEARRRSEWTLALDLFLRTNPSPEACREAAVLVADHLSLPGLQAYYEELLQREKIGQIESLIATEHWTSAEEELQEIEGRTTDYRRLACRLAVGRARAAGPLALAEELARSWADALAAFGHDAYDLLEEALGGVWERRETAALRKLEEIVRRASRTADLPPEVRDRIQNWLRWLQVEKALEESAGASSLRQLSVFARENQSSPHLRPRLRSWIERWRQRDEMVALAWAFRAFPDLFRPGEADPAEELATRSRAVTERVLLTVRARPDLEIADLRGLHQQIERCERDWRDLYDYLDLVPQQVERPAMPVEFQEARDLFDSLLRVVEGIERLESCDLRQPSADSSWKAARLALLQDLKGLPVTEGLLLRLERMAPLTKLTHFETRLRQTAARCNDPDPQELDQPGLFAEAAEWARAIVGCFEKASMVRREMWDAVSTEYWREIPHLAGDLEAPPVERDLPSLAYRLDALEAEEQEIRQALRRLDAEEPWVSAVGPFLPESHQPYLELYPRKRPASRRAFRLFDRFARVGARPVILRDGAGNLPAWVADYLNRGVP